MNQDESNAFTELERLVQTELSAVANVGTETVLCSAPAPRKRLQQIAIPGDRDAAMLKAARSVVEAGVRTPEALAGFLDKTFPNKKVRQYSQAFWDFVGIVDPSLRGTHDWHAIYAKQDKPNRKPARKKATPKAEYLPAKPMPVRPTQAMRDIIESLPPPHREILRDLLVNGISIKDAAKTHGISETAIGNVLRRGEAHIRLMLDRAPSKATVQVQDGIVNELNRAKSPTTTPVTTNMPQGGFFSWLFGRKKSNKPARTWRKAWAAWNLNSYPSQLLHDDPQSGHRIHSEIRSEVVSKGGKRAILVGMAWHGRSMAVHEFNAGGMPSRGPYYVKSGNWKSSGRRHVAKVAKAKDGYSFESSHPTQNGGGIPTQLIMITEFDTEKNEPFDYDAFVALAEKNPASVGCPEPD